MTKERDFGLDLTRAAAAVLVMSVHFFMNTGYYNFPIDGPVMVLAAVLRMVCMVCVPLFLLLTGYLCSGRGWSPGYYRRLLPVLLIYGLAGIACMAYRTVWGGEEITLLDGIRRLLEFSAAPYAWYVEMYIGLFLLIPFVNAAWRGLDERGRLALTVTLLTVTALPTVSNALWHLLPGWWTGLYPLTYYVLGAWLRDHPVRMAGWKLALGWLGLAAAVGLLMGAVRWGQTFAYAEFNYWGSLFVTGETVCAFSLLRRADGARVPAPARWCVRQIARLALPIYLMSYIVDRLIYPLLTARVPTMAGRLLWMPAVVPAVLVCSALLAAPVDLAAAALMRLVPEGKRGADS